MVSPVTAQRERRIIPTYALGAPSPAPVFFEKRVYQGSCGKVYPVPFIDKVADTSAPQPYDSVRLENDLVRLVLLPEIGGRIFLGQDKVNRDYDFFYRQDVIKPALVGLAGPWISGGVNPLAAARSGPLPEQQSLPVVSISVLVLFSSVDLLVGGGLRRERRGPT